MITVKAGSLRVGDRIEYEIGDGAKWMRGRIDRILPRGVTDEGKIALTLYLTNRDSLTVTGDADIRKMEDGKDFYSMPAGVIEFEIGDETYWAEIVDEQPADNGFPAEFSVFDGPDGEELFMLAPYKI
jgi:hypothetical protein